MKYLLILTILLAAGCTPNSWVILDRKTTSPTTPTPSPTPIPEPSKLFYTFYINYNSLCLEVDGSDLLIQNNCDMSGSSQKFEIVESGTNFKIKTPGSTTKCLTHDTNQAEVLSVDCLDGSLDQEWNKILTSSGDYQILNVGTGNCFNIPNGYSTPGLALILYSCGSTGNEEQNEIFQIIESN